MKVFLSWSGQNSREIAKLLKVELENIFGHECFSVFMSEEDILSGEYWHEKIRKELEESTCAILCITKENRQAPWILYEAGALAMNKSKSHVISLIFDTEIEPHSPLSHFQNRNFNKKEYNRVLYDLRMMGSISYTDSQFSKLIGNSFEELFSQIKGFIDVLHGSETFNNILIYPESVHAIKKCSIFISAPMASLNNNSRYIALRDDILKIKKSLEVIDEITEVNYPGEHINDNSIFDGGAKAIEENFRKLKESDYFILIYPKKVPSSSLIEVGYSIALSKKILVFTPSRNVLPYMLKSADQKINHVAIYTYGNIEEISQIITKNGISIFR